MGEVTTEADRERVRSRLRDLEREYDAIGAEYPDHDDEPDAVVTRSLELMRCIGELYIQLGECRYCGQSSIPEHAFCEECREEMRKIADEVLAELAAEGGV